MRDAGIAHARTWGASYGGESRAHDAAQSHPAMSGARASDDASTPHPVDNRERERRASEQLHLYYRDIFYSDSDFLTSQWSGKHCRGGG